MIKLYSGGMTVEQKTVVEPAWYRTSDRHVAVDYSYTPTQKTINVSGHELFGFELMKHRYYVNKDHDGTICHVEDIIKTKVIVFLDLDEIQSLYNNVERFWEVNIAGTKRVIDDKQKECD